jgi:hypothetical protein
LILPKDDPGISISSMIITIVAIISITFGRSLNTLFAGQAGISPKGEQEEKT